jgi:Mg2+ and Co2+ transporter CorA
MTNAAIKDYVKSADLDAIVTDFSDQLEATHVRISELYQKLLDKPDKDDIDVLTADKLKIEDIPQYIPDQEALEDRVKVQVVDMFSDMQKKQMQTMQLMDNKLVQMRKEIDIETIEKTLMTKADAN